MHFSDTPTSTAIFALVFLLGGLAATAIRAWHEQIQTTHLILMNVCAKLYVGGCNLYEIIRDGIVLHSNAIDGYVLADIAMLAMRDYHRSRLIHGHVTCGSVSFSRAWVEVKIVDTWWVIDLSSCFVEIMPRSHYRRLYHPQAEVVYHYQDFWQDRRMTELYQQMSQDKTSYIVDDLCQRHLIVA